MLARSRACAFFFTIFTIFAEARCSNDLPMPHGMRQRDLAFAWQSPQRDPRGVVHYVDSALQVLQVLQGALIAGAAVQNPVR